jgi:hypothetical protein
MRTGREPFPASRLKIISIRLDVKKSGVARYGNVVGLKSLALQLRCAVGWHERDREKERYYLLPGMGGGAYRRKRKKIIQCTLAIGLVVSAIVAGILYVMSRRW